MPTRTTTWATNDIITANDLNALAGAWNSYTPQIDQGATTDIAKTVTYAKYLQFGKLVICNVVLDVSGTGTAGAGVVASLPVTASSASVTAIGAGFIMDASAGSLYYSGAAAIVTATLVAVRAYGLAQVVGNTPSFALAAGDRIGLHLMYEAA